MRSALGARGNQCTAARIALLRAPPPASQTHNVRAQHVHDGGAGAGADGAGGGGLALVQGVGVDLQ